MQIGAYATACHDKSGRSADGLPLSDRPDKGSRPLLKQAVRSTPRDGASVDRAAADRSVVRDA